VVRQAIRQTYTYYDPDGSARIVERETLAGGGKAWVEGAYNPPVYPSPLNVRVADAGIKVWIVIKWLRFYKDDVDKVLAAYAPMLQGEDIEAALAYYRENRQAIDEKLQDESGTA